MSEKFCVLDGEIVSVAFNAGADWPEDKRWTIAWYDVDGLVIDARAYATPEDLLFVHGTPELVSCTLQPALTFWAENAAIRSARLYARCGCCGTVYELSPEDRRNSVIPGWVGVCAHCRPEPQVRCARCLRMHDPECVAAEDGVCDECHETLHRAAVLYAKLNYTPTSDVEGTLRLQGMIDDLHLYTIKEHMMAMKAALDIEDVEHCYIVCFVDPLFDVEF